MLHVLLLRIIETIEDEVVTEMIEVEVVTETIEVEVVTETIEDKIVTETIEDVTTDIAEEVENLIAEDKLA